MALPVQAVGGEAARREAAGALRIVSRTATADPNITRAAFEAELPPTTGASPDEARSVSGAVNVDCASGRVRVEAYAVYAESRLQGRPLVQVGRQSHWLAVAGDTTLGRIKAAVCAGFATPRAPRPGAARPEPAARPARSPTPLARVASRAVDMTAPQVRPSTPSSAVAGAARDVPGRVADATAVSPPHADAPLTTAADARLSAAAYAASPSETGASSTGALKLRGRL
jgi:hypothetical protein